jgi:hypothetical protein
VARRTGRSWPQVIAGHHVVAVAPEDRLLSPLRTRTVTQQWTKFELAMNFRPPSAQDQAAVDHVARSLEGDLLRCMSQELGT